MEIDALRRRQPFQWDDRADVVGHLGEAAGAVAGHRAMVFLVMLDGADPVPDWPILNAMLNSACGATGVSFHHGGGVGVGYSRHSGIAVLADGTAEAAERLGRIFWNDPATGVMRHADAGYQSARDCATANGLWLPMSEVA